MSSSEQIEGIDNFAKHQLEAEENFKNSCTLFIYRNNTHHSMKE